MKVKWWQKGSLIYLKLIYIYYKSWIYIYRYKRKMGTTTILWVSYSGSVGGFSSRKLKSVWGYGFFKMKIKKKKNDSATSRYQACGPRISCMKQWRFIIGICYMLWIRNPWKQKLRWKILRNKSKKRNCFLLKVKVKSEKVKVNDRFLVLYFS